MEKVIKALVAIQAEVKTVKKNKKNAFHNYEYADMESYLKELRPLLRQHGCALFFSIDEENVISPGHVTVSGTATLMHDSGEKLEIRSRGEGTDISSKGAAGDKATYKAITGFRKYALACMFNIATSLDPELDERKPSKGKLEPGSTRPVADVESGSAMQYHEDIYIADVQQKSQMKNGKSFTTYWLKTDKGKYYSTLKKELADRAKEFKESGVPVVIACHPSQRDPRYMDLMDIVEFSTEYKQIAA